MKAVISLFSVLMLAGCFTSYDEYSPGAMLKKYEWFKNQYEAIQQIDRRLVDAEKQAGQFVRMPGDSQLTWQDKDERQRLNAVRQGYASQYNALVAEYNAQSKKFNWSYFKTRDLPLTIEYR